MVERNYPHQRPFLALPTQLSRLHPSLSANVVREARLHSFPMSPGRDLMHRISPAFHMTVRSSRVRGIIWYSRLWSRRRVLVPREYVGCYSRQPSSHRTSTSLCIRRHPLSPFSSFGIDDPQAQHPTPMWHIVLSFGERHRSFVFAYMAEKIGIFSSVFAAFSAPTRRCCADMMSRRPGAPLRAGAGCDRTQPRAPVRSRSAARSHGFGRPARCALRALVSCNALRALLGSISTLRSGPNVSRLR